MSTQAPIVISDEDEYSRAEKATSPARQAADGSTTLVLRKVYEGRWESPEAESVSLSDSPSGRRKNSRDVASEDKADSLSFPEESDDSDKEYNPSKGASRPKKPKPRRNAANGRKDVDSLKKSTGREISRKRMRISPNGKTVSMPKPGQKLETGSKRQADAEQAHKVLERPSGGKTQPEGVSRERIGPQVTARPFSGGGQRLMEPAKAADLPAAKKKSPYFTSGGSSQAVESLKPFRKVSLTSPGNREGNGKRKTPVHTAAPASGADRKSSESTSGLEDPSPQPVLKKPRRSPSPAGPSENRASWARANQIDERKAASAAKPVSSTLAQPSGSSLGDQSSAPDRERQKKSPTSKDQQGATGIAAQAADRVGDWNPCQEVASSEAEAGASPEPSSIIVEATDSPSASREIQSLPSYHTASVGPLDTRLHSTADTQPTLGEVSVVCDTPVQDVSCSSLSSSEQGEPGANPAPRKGSLRCEGQEDMDTSVGTPLGPGPAKQQEPAAKLSASKDPQSLSREAEQQQRIIEELRELETCEDEELVKKLPQIAASPEALSLISMTERRKEIERGLQKRHQRLDTESFRRDLFANMDRKGQEKKQSKGAPKAALLATSKPKQAVKVQAAPKPKQVAEKPKQAAKSTEPLDVKTALWEPPPSPFYLIEEVLYDNPWKLLVACMLLNKTTGRAVRKILWKLFELAPTPEAAALADTEEVESIIKPLGLFRKRAVMFKRFSREYLEKDWTDPRQLHGMGQYATDAYNLFCRNKWREMKAPQDKDLLKYYDWLKSTDGQGNGFEREVFAMPSESQSSLKSGVVDICSPAIQSRRAPEPGGLGSD